LPKGKNLRKRSEVIIRKKNKSMFYPDIKPHISPSALDNWVNSRSQFIRSYFAGVKTPETASMKTGKQIHALIEGGLLDAKHKFPNNEQVLEFFAEKYKVLGIPDSFSTEEDGKTAVFVDYKTGKENNWDANKLASDLKMKTTAWLVWNFYGRMLPVVGHIEYIPTRWNEVTREIELTGGESVVAASITYTSEELEAFTSVILAIIGEVNEEYPKWLESSADFVNQEDAAEYARLNAQVAELEIKMDEIKERIAGQLDFGGARTAETEFGTFYFTERKTYDYPKTLKINYLDYGLMLEDTEDIATAVKAAKTKFETENEPKSISRSLAFKAKKKK